MSRGADASSVVERILRRLTDREEGQALVEYALILALIAIVCIGALTVLGTNISDVLSNISTRV